MKEIRDIIRSYQVHKSLEKRCALATVVHVEGSSYRRPGARMLISEDGRLTGARSVFFLISKIELRLVLLWYFLVIASHYSVQYHYKIWMYLFIL